MRVHGLRIGFVMCASFCTFDEAIQQMKRLKDQGAEILPILSENAARIDTRFGKAADFIAKIEGIAERKIIRTIEDAEPVGPKNLADIILIAPCTGNTLAKLASGITDSAALMAVKGHLRNNKPVVISLASNDALGFNLENIGKLLNAKNIYFVPFRQDNYSEKPKSMTAKMEMILPTLEKALKKEQLQPIVG